MAFGSTPILDDFNRANTGPPPSSNWTNFWWLGSGMIVDSNQLYETGAFVDAYWNVNQYGDCELRAKIVTVDTMLFGIRIANPGASVDGYIFYKSGTTGRIERLDNGAETLLGSTFTISVSAGDSLGLEMIGDALTVYQDAGSTGVWTPVATRNDSTYTSGYLGLGTLGSLLRMDDFGGGSPPVYVPGYVGQGDYSNHPKIGRLIAA